MMWTIDDDVIRLRECGTRIVHRLPSAGAAIIGSGMTATLQVIDPTGKTAAEHAKLEHDPLGWTARAVGDATIRGDGALHQRMILTPGLELGIGGLSLVAESRRLLELRAFMARMLGYADDQAATVDRAMRRLRLAAQRVDPLVLIGPGYLIAVAHAIHRRVLGADAPFVVSDPRRREGEESVRSAANYDTGMSALWSAVGGSLCMWSRRLPEDIEEAREALRDPALDVQVIVCAEIKRRAKLYHVEPIVIPSLASRPDEVPRIIDEYAEDAAEALKSEVHLTAADRVWIYDHSASTIPEIEKGTLRLLAIQLRDGNVAAGARLLGMAPISLSRWVGRRKLPGARRPAGAPPELWNRTSESA